MTAKPLQEMYVGIGVVLLSILAYFIAIPAGIVVPDAVEIQALSPDFWPAIIIFVLGLAGLSLFVPALIASGLIPGLGAPSGSGKTNSIQAEESSDQLPLGKAAFRVATFIAILFAIYFAIPLIGMVVATIPTIMFLCWYAGERRWKIIIPLAIFLPLILYLFFVYVANVPIPNGVFESLG